jgi:hypothetical protein
MLFWPYDGDSGPLEVSRSELEIDGRAGTDCVVRIGDRGGTHWEMLVFLRDGGGWRFAHCVAVPGQSLLAPTARVECAPDGRHWLVIRACLGADGNAISYALFGDTWLSVSPSGVRIALAATIKGYDLRLGRPGSAEACWELDSQPCRLAPSPNGLILEYPLVLRAGAVSGQRVSGIPPPLTAGAELFTRRFTARFRWDPSRRVFETIPGASPWERAPIMEALLNGPDGFVTAAVEDLMVIARRGTADQRAWLALYLTQCATSPARDSLLEALDESKTGAGP